MNYGICPLSSVPVRRTAADGSEMITQLLFGETFEILKQKKNWQYIRCTWDDYEGWIDEKQGRIIEEKDLGFYTKECAYSLELTQGAMSNNYYLPILLGSNLPDYDGIKFSLLGQAYTFSGNVINPKETKIDAELLIKIARRYLFAPYLWGGRSPFGVDCSGLVQVVFKMLGINLKRDTTQQIHEGQLVDFIQEVRPGDLAFFQNAKGKTCHVGILLPEGKILHASGYVRIDYLDHYGIFNANQGKYTHQLRVIKRVLAEDESNMEGFSLPQTMRIAEKPLF